MGNWPHCKQCGRTLILESGGGYICPKTDCDFEWDPGTEMLKMSIAKQSIEELVEAMENYEMNADEPAPEMHQRMMDRARDFLKTVG